MPGNQVRVPVSTPGAKQSASELDQLRDKFTKLQSQGAKGLAIGAGAAVASAGLGLLEQAASGVIGVIGDSIQAASNLNETLNKSKVVFGDASVQMEKFGKTAATSLGLSEDAAVGAAASIGNLLLSTGTAKDKIEPMSEAIVKLASDLASFNNIDPAEALAKLQSGLVGQERPLRELGVAISAASVDSEALALGFHKVNNEFTEGEKVQARYSLIFKQTKTAQGDFARTSTGLANEQRIASAKIVDAEAKIGKAFADLETVVLPPIADAVGSAADAVSKLEAGMEAFGSSRSPEQVAQGLRGVFDSLSFLTDGNPILKSFRQGLDVAFADPAPIKVFTATVNRELYGSARTFDRYGEGLGSLATKTKKVGTTSEAAVPLIHNLTDGFDSARQAASQLDGALKDLDTQLHGRKILAGDVAQAQQDVIDATKAQSDAVDHLTDLTKKGKEPTDHSSKAWKAWHEKVAEARRQVAILTGDLEKNRETLFDLQYQQKQQEGPKALYDWLLEQQASLNKADLKAQAYMETLRALALLSSNMPPVNFVQNYIDRLPSGKSSGTTQRFAEGGIVKATPGGTLALIGEAGQDEAVIPIGRGSTAGKLVAGGGGGTVINIHIHGVSVLTPGAAEEVVRRLEPHITRAQQRRGLFGVGAR